MVAVQETIDTVKTLDIDQYKYGFSTDIESDKAPKGLDEDTIRFISAKKGRAGMDAEMASGGIRALEDHGRT